MDNNLTLPKVSIILPVYNCGNYIEESIESLLTQSFKNIEIIVIDDFSSDDTVEKILLFDDSRIKLYKNKENLGISKCLNLGISNSNGEYIARMDGDDISHKDRILKQVEFLELNTDIEICGTGYKILGKNQFFQPKLSYVEIIIQLTLDCPIAHPTIMGRRRIFEKYQYAFEFEPCEDLELWTRLVPKYKFANLEEKLLSYRVHSQQVSTKSSSLQIELSKNMIESYIFEISGGNQFYKYFATYPLMNENDFIKYKSVENSIINYWDKKGIHLEEIYLVNRMRGYLRINFWRYVNLRDISFEMIFFFIRKIGVFRTFKTLIKKLILI